MSTIKGPVTLTDNLAQEFRQYLLIYKDQKPETVKNSVRVFSCIEKFLGGRPFALQNCEEYLGKLKEEGKTQSTRATILYNIRLICEFLEKKHAVVSFAKDLPAIAVDPTVIETLSLSEIKRIIEYPYPDSPNTPLYNLFIETLARTGRRISEIVDLKVGDIDFSTKTFLIRNPKNGIPRYLPLPTDLTKSIETVCVGKDHASHVFEIITNKKTKQFTKSTIRWVLSERAKKLGIRKQVSPHIFRHSFPVELLRRKVPLPLVSELMGHESWESSKRYTHLVLDDIRAASNFHPLNQDNLQIEEIIESVKKDMSRYQLHTRNDLQYETHEENGVYTIKIKW